VCERCLLAETPLTRLRGLLGRRELPPGEGLYLRPASSIHMFFMRFPIDAVWVDKDLKVVGISPNVAPWKLAWCKGAKAVFELPAGEAAHRGVQVGEQLVFQNSN
jgi:uncharacterized protein